MTINVECRHRFADLALLSNVHKYQPFVAETLTLDSSAAGQVCELDTPPPRTLCPLGSS